MSFNLLSFYIVLTIVDMIHQCFITVILCVTKDNFPFLICF